MAVYLLPKTRLLSKAAITFKPNPNKWSAKWTVVRRSISSGKHQDHQQQQQQQGRQSKAAGGWLTWRGVFLRWTPIGICMIAAAQWHLHNRELDRKGLPRTAASWQMNMYCSLPLRMMSRAWGWLADCRVPTPARPLVYGLYSTAFGVNIEEAASSDFK
ncbi:uncharacterized protein LOC134224275 isoform X2 [Armigeres subalbatus]|uniref:uncharacterized protein LOC134224275 isoform X2 n=1 Tax=Armigeres subalbatus TaxID=124917 RepID=UPI002ED60C93